MCTHYQRHTEVLKVSRWSTGEGGGAEPLPKDAMVTEGHMGGVHKVLHQKIPAIW